MLRKLKAFPGLILAPAIAFSFYRCFFGVDFTDEAQYLAQGYAPLIGGTPFHTDLFIQQTVSLLLTPALWLYTRLIGSSDGIVLFFRILWWATACACALLLFGRLRKITDPSLAALLSGFLILFVPFNIHAPSYNSFGMLFLTLGLLVPQLLSSGQLIWLGLAAVCYPPFALAMIGVLCIAIFRTKTRETARRQAAIFAGIAFILGVVAIFGIGWHRIQETLAFSNAFGTFGWNEKLHLWAGQLRQLKNSPIAAACLAAPIITAIFGKKAVPTVLVSSIPVFLVPSLFPYSFFAAHYWILFLSIAGLPLFLGKNSPEDRTWIPHELIIISILCGTVSAWSSSNGLFNAAIGIFPAFLAGLSEVSRKMSGGRSKWFTTIALFLLGLGFVRESLQQVYRDSPVSQLDSRIASGPYRGLWTTSQRAQFLNDLSSDLAKLPSKKGGIFFLYGFPAGYLLTSRPPTTRMLFLHARTYPENIRALLLPRSPESSTEWPEWVVRVKQLPGFPPYPDGDPVLNSVFLEPNRYTFVMGREAYSILKKTF